MLGSYHRFILEQVLSEHNRKMALEQEAIDQAVSELPEPFLEEDEGSIERPIVLGDYQERKAVRNSR